MGIVSLPDGMSAEGLTCAICHVKLTLDKATAGPLDCEGNQAFACVSHFSEVEKLINGWADFLGEQRLKYLAKGKEPEDMIYGGSFNG